MMLALLVDKVREEVRRRPLICHAAAVGDCDGGDPSLPTRLG